MSDYERKKRLFKKLPPHARAFFEDLSELHIEMFLACDEFFDGSRTIDQIEGRLAGVAKRVQVLQRMARRLVREKIVCPAESVNPDEVIECGAPVPVVPCCHPACAPPIAGELRTRGLPAPAATRQSSQRSLLDD